MGSAGPPFLFFIIKPSGNVLISEYILLIIGLKKIPDIMLRRLPNSFISGHPFSTQENSM
jgi:hypothetical protein